MSKFRANITDEPINYKLLGVIRYSNKFTNYIFEYVFKAADLENFGININGENLTRLKLADAIALIADRIDYAML